MLFSGPESDAKADQKRPKRKRTSELLVVALFSSGLVLARTACVRCHEAKKSSESQLSK